MNILFSLVLFFWCARTIKVVFFWMYLWQLKNYHVGRFVDHFRTHQGKKILTSPLFFIKLLFLSLMVVHQVFAYLLLVIYVIETAQFFAAFLKRSIKKPVFTFKAILLTSILLLAPLAWFLWLRMYLQGPQFLQGLLVFDLLLPIIVSLVVLGIQPLFVMARNRILKKAAQKISEHKNLTVIGITGSYGKTTTKEFLATILSAKYNILATPEHKNSEIGIAQTILEDLQPEHEIFIVEMGAYNKGGIKLLCDMVRPKIGIVTGVNMQHLATFGSVENLLSAEGGRELAAHLPIDGVFIANGDNKYCLDAYKSVHLPKKIYTVEQGTLQADMWTESLEVTEDSLSFIAHNSKKELAHITVAVPGRHNVQNLLGAILVAQELDMSLEEISAACVHIKPEQGGMNITTGVHGITVIDSSYSANPDGVMADLAHLALYTGKKVAVMPCLIELGSASAQTHYDIGKKMGQVCDLAIITTKDAFKELSEGFLSNGPSERKILLCKNPQEAFALITIICKKGDAVLLEGRVPERLSALLKKA